MKESQWKDACIYLLNSLHEHLFVFSENELPIDNGSIVDSIENVAFLVS